MNPYGLGPEWAIAIVLTLFTIGLYVYAAIELGWV